MKKLVDLGLAKDLKKNDLKKMEFNHSYWEKNAQKNKLSHSVSWGDINVINLEIKNVSKYLKNGDFVLDAGCSNGFSTFEIAKTKKIQINAFDYSKESIKYALKSRKKNLNGSKISFYHANILNIPESDNSFDKAYTIRVIINLLSWDLQKKSILEIHRVLKPGGLYLMSEAFSGSLKKINILRREANLSELIMHDFNLYLEEKKLERFLSKYFHIVKIEKFSSIYYAASRFLRYLTIKNAERDSFINNFNNFFKDFQETENSGDFGVQKLYILKKKK